MILGNNDILRFTLRSTFLGQVCLNVFHYVTELIDVGAEPTEGAFFAAFGREIFPQIRNISSFLVEFETGKLENLSFPTRPYATVNYGVAGNVPNDVPPSSVAYSVKLLVGSRKTRSGGKRFAGVSETNIAGNTVLPPMMTELEELADMLGTQMVHPVTPLDPFIAFKPIVLKHYTTETPTALDWQLVTGGTASNILGTQNTRKQKRS